MIRPLEPKCFLQVFLASVSCKCFLGSVLVKRFLEVLLEIQSRRKSRCYEGGPRFGRNPAIRTTSRPEAHLRQDLKASPDYLRAAHAYMLISMPTGTSTIFGAFQAILALLAKGRSSALLDKLPRHEKFASEIFCRKPPRVLCCGAKTYCDTLPRSGFKTTSDQRVS
jgi:hypothetical protein